MRTGASGAAWAAACALLCPIAGAAGPGEGGPSSWTNRTSLRTEAFSGSRSLDSGDADGAIGAMSLWTAGRLQAPGGRFVWDATVRAQHRLGGVPPARVRELYWRQPVGESVDIRVGRLMPAWGRADGWNPTDNLSPRDFRLLAPEAQDQRFGRDGLQADGSLPGGLGQLTVHLFAAGASHRMASPKAQGARIVQEKAPRRADWAIKWERFGQGWDASVSYARGADLTPDVGLAGADGQGALLALSNRRRQVLGIDASWQRGPFVWRGEASWSAPMSRSSDSFERKRPAAWLVAGPEWTGGAWTLGAQGVWQRVQGFRNAATAVGGALEREVALYQSALSNQTAGRQLGLTLHVAHRAWNDTLRSELATLVLWPHGEARQDASTQGLVRAKIDYAVDDAWNLQLGLDWPFGPQRSFFGLWKDNRLAYLQLRRDF